MSLRTSLVGASALALLACSGGHRDKPTPTPLPIDAGVIDGISTLPGTDPTAGHLDGDAPHGTSGGSNAAHHGRSLEIALKSTPPGAMAMVDGVAVGPTPTFWEGEFTGREREFAFVLAGHGVARYRFVPVANGVVHARLEAIEDKTARTAVLPAPSAIYVPKPTPPAPAPAPVPAPAPAPPPPPPPDAAVTFTPTVDAGEAVVPAPPPAESGQPVTSPQQ